MFDRWYSVGFIYPELVSGSNELVSGSSELVSGKSFF
ncbi:hypothetical protein [Flavobacterium sp. Arc2]